MHECFCIKTARRAVAMKKFSTRPRVGSALRRAAGRAELCTQQLI
jgi:hypothetical protein